MGCLYLVPTPVGNLEDITMRALRVLKEVDLILAEDTRTTGILLRHYEIRNSLCAHHKFNEHQTAEVFAKRMAAGEDMALVTDAGTPGISDPGFMLVRACAAEGVAVICLPGATAFVPALVDSGLPCERFTFEGFLPQKKGRQTRIQQLCDEPRTMIFYESPYRVVKTLEELAEALGGDRRASVSREISKLHEETLRGTLEELAAHFKTTAPRGEFVMIVEGLNRKKSKEVETSAHLKE
ncbi:16S rRNA (cytidine(1402)-2'-O)-methyltransferase [Alloprevotella tannerae]|uniref:16S rRNA (cytidine(1402)-2'-O)-methyltransferase n=1 Tax=Alloprevotella tannerae TaxID=76122 RepID=UPI003C6EF4A1